MTIQGKAFLRVAQTLLLALWATSAQIVILALAPWDARAQEGTTGDGAVVYQLYCASCHEAGVARAATRTTLAKLPAESIQLALTEGAMKQQAASLTSEQRTAVIHFLAPNAAQESRKVDTACAAEKKPYAASLSRPRWNGWGNGLEQTRFQPASQARLAPDQVPRLKVKWAFGFPGAISASSQPAIVDGRVFVGSTGRKMYSLDAKTGCTHWEFATEFPVRTAITVGKSGGTTAVFFGDQHGTAYALDAANGKLLWKTRVEDYGSSMITGSPTLAGKVLLVPIASNEDLFGASPTYQCCKFRGSVSALDAATGKVLWKSYTVAEEPKPAAKNKQGVQLWGPSGAGVWSSPTVDNRRGAVYVTTGNSHSDPTATTSDAFVAFDLKTGRMLWSQQMTASDSYTLACDLPEAMRANCPATNGPDHDFSSSGILVNLGHGRRALIAGQKSGVVHALDPDANGKVLWHAPVGKGGRVGGVQWGSATDGKNVYVALSDAGFVPAAPGSPGAQPALGASILFDPNKGGGLFALDAATGAVRWSTPHPGCGARPACSPSQSAAVTAIPGIVFSGGLDGVLRAYASGDGKIVWETDTMHDFQTVNGVAAHGGSLNGPGAVVVDGMLFANSGYLHLGTVPGNVLLAFSVDGK